MDEWWRNRDDLVNALRLFGDLKGFYTVLKNGTIWCNRYGDKEYVRNFAGGGLQCECTFMFNIKARFNPKKSNRNANTTLNKKKRNYNRPVFGSHTKIIYTHGLKKNPFHPPGIMVDCANHLLEIL